MSAAQHSPSSSVYPPPVRNSERRNEPELGDSEGESRRMESVSGASEDARVNACRRGLRTLPGMEWESEGAKAVGWSYLPSQSASAIQRTRRGHRGTDGRRTGHT